MRKRSCSVTRYDGYCHALSIDRIILEERSKMKRKILDVTVLCMFCICLIVTANIEEKSAGRTCERQTRTNESAMTDENAAPVAGVCRTLSGYSFTTESDEKTGISKKQTTLVTASENKDSDEEVAGQDREDEKEAEENQAVLAGLAKPVSVTAETEEESTVPAGLAKPVSMTAETEEESAVPAGLAEPVDAAEAMSTTAAQNRWDITLTQDEIDLLAKIVWLESRGEPVEGQEAVVEVIFNRMTSGKFPTTVYEVLSQGNPVQFCSWKNRDYAEPTEKEYQSIQNVLDGKTSILRNDTLYFSTEPLTPRIDRQIGGHSFCY